MSGQMTSLLLVGIGVLSMLSQWLAWRARLPAILFLLASGALIGPATGWLVPDELFGHLLFPLISLAVAVILFEGGLTLRLEEIRGLETSVRRLLTVGVLITWGITTGAAWLFAHLSWEMAVLFGAITVVTGPTVIVPMLRTVRPNARVASVLRWEGIVIDPIGALLAVLVFEFVVSHGGAQTLADTLASFAVVVSLGVLIGAAAGYLWGLILRNYWLPEYLHSVGTLVAVFVVSLLANQVHAESGLLAVTVMGVWLANMRRVPLEDILNFKESLSLLLISGLFIILAARIDPTQLLALGWGAAALLLSMQFIARPLAIAVTTLGSPLTGRERALLAWIAPRGIVAAAVSAVFALRLAEMGNPQASLLVPLTFLVIVATVVLQSVTARPLARLLGVVEPPPRGVLIVGANSVGRALGKALKVLDFPVLLVDTNWDNLQAARMQDLPVYFGNPTSEHAERNLSRTGLGRMVAVSPRTDLNRLVSLHFAKEFGRNAVFHLPSGETARQSSKIRHRNSQDNLLFGSDATYAKLASLLSRGAEVRTTKLSEKFGWEDYRRAHGELILLFAVDPGGRLHVHQAGDAPAVEAGWTVLSLVAPDEPALKVQAHSIKAES